MNETYEEPEVVEDTTSGDSLAPPSRTHTVLNLKPVSNQELFKKYGVKTREVFSNLATNTETPWQIEHYDTNGLLLRVEGVKSQDPAQADTTYTYNSSGQLVRKDVGTDPPRHTVYSWAGNNLTRKKDFLDNRLQLTRFFYYNNRGLVKRYTVIEEDCKGCDEKYEVLYEFDRQDRIERSASYRRDKSDSNGLHNLAAASEYSYNRKGLTVQEEHLDYHLDDRYRSKPSSREVFYRYNRNRMLSETKTRINSMVNTEVIQRLTREENGLPQRLDQTQDGEELNHHTYRYTFYD